MWYNHIFKIFGYELMKNTYTVSYRENNWITGTVLRSKLKTKYKWIKIRIKDGK